ncbi:hypothetical protein EYS14_09175 [Alteromonadaceae bacterium M269]|nr:hypothetical protein EYS14_09175 [Alteromonadaceae bacterium M269]
MNRSKSNSNQYVSLRINAAALMQLLSSRSLVAQDVHCLDPQSKKVLSELLVNATIEEGMRY